MLSRTTKTLCTTTTATTTTTTKTTATTTTNRTTTTNTTTNSTTTTYLMIGQQLFDALAPPFETEDGLHTHWQPH